MILLLSLVLCSVLIACIFAASITAARQAQDINVSQEDGFAYIKGSNFDVMKTSEAMIFEEGVAIGKMDNEQLRNIKEMILKNGDLRFVVKGHARDELNDSVLLLVEGGTIAYDTNGIVGSTGNTKILLEATFYSDALVEGSEGQRRLWTACSICESETGSGTCDAKCRKKQNCEEKCEKILGI